MVQLFEGGFQLVFISGITVHGNVGEQRLDDGLGEDGGQGRGNAHFVIEGRKIAAIGVG